MESKSQKSERDILCMICEEVASFESMQCKNCAAPVCQKCIQNWEQQYKGQLTCIYGCNIDPNIPFSNRFEDATHEKLKKLKNAMILCSNCGQNLKAKQFKKHLCPNNTEQNTQTGQQLKFQQYIVNQQKILSNLQQTIADLSQNNVNSNALIDQEQIKEIMENKILKIAKENDWLMANDGWFDSFIIEKKDMTSLQRKTIPYFQQYKVLYRMSQNGSSNRIFHSRVDDHPNTITLIKANDGAIFGGFTSIPWKSTFNQTYSIEPFILDSLRNEHQILKSQFSLYNNDAYQAASMHELAFLPSRKVISQQELMNKLESEQKYPYNMVLKTIQTYIFSIYDGIKKRNRIFSLQDTNKAVGHWEKWGPCFGAKDLMIDLDVHINSSVNLGNSFIESGSKINDNKSKSLSQILCLGPIWSINEVEVIEIM